MSNSSNKFIQLFKSILPSPFTIAVLITFFTVFLALLLTEGKGEQLYIFEIAEFWNKGFWSLLQFTMQMMLILVLGHILALSPIVDSLIIRLLKLVKGSASAAVTVCFFTLCFALFNWGLGLIFGAIFARKVGEYARINEIEINYPLVGAAGYSGLMVWHGGLSGSAPITVAGENHNLIEKIGIIPVDATIFSNMNITASILLLLLVPLLVFFLAKKGEITKIEDLPNSIYDLDDGISEDNLVGAEKLNHSKTLAFLTAFFFIGTAIVYVISQQSFQKALSLNFINFLLFGLGILTHSTFAKFTNAAQTAINGSVGIMIQFPLYAGIMGIMKYSGLIVLFSDFFVQISNQFSFPFLTFLSAGLVNLFVPSGGGQWAVQGPIIIEASQTLNVPIWKSVMALAYGDQLTNMLQPFWALPLLGITGLKAYKVLPYTFLFMLLGIVIFCFCLAIF